MANEWLGRGKRASDHPAPAPVAPQADAIVAAAIQKKRIGVAFQPQIELASGRVCGVEALARWFGGPSATELFSRAARSRLSERLSRQVQRLALQTAGRWSGPLAALDLSINLLPEDLCRPGFADWLLAEIGAAAFDPRRLTVEITESSLLADPATARAALCRLRASGVRVAVDDFGTGYASLAYLTSLPLDTLKIDQGLIAAIAGGERDRIVVRALIGLAHELELKVVVEGVETASQLALLHRWGCDVYQGFIGAGALDELELERFVTAAMARAA